MLSARSHPVTWPPPLHSPGGGGWGMGVGGRVGGGGLPRRPAGGAALAHAAGQRPDYLHLFALQCFWEGNKSGLLSAF